MSTPTTALARELVSTACQAPSVHNTQPWAWRIHKDGSVIELYADRSRQLPATDPQGRDLCLSCGAALHHLTISARAFGLGSQATLLPEPGMEDLLARVQLTPGSPSEVDVELLAALENRMTDRRGFVDWEVPFGRLEHMARAGQVPGVHVVVLTDPRHVAHTEALLERARLAQLSDTAVRAEQDAWQWRTRDDGVPGLNANPPRRPGVEPRRDRFSGTGAASDPRAGLPEALVVLGTTKDDPDAWLRTGEALSALWIEATRQGLAVTPQSHVIEVDETRGLLGTDVLEEMLLPQIVLRVGWPETARPPLARTPRRSLDDVLLP